MSESVIIKRSAAVHSGRFHADDVTAIALLLWADLIDVNKVSRTRDPNILFKCEYVCDVGGIFDERKKRFDHHQASYLGKHASAGLVLNYIEKEGYMSSRCASMLRYSLVNAVDENDNGIENAEGANFSKIIDGFYLPKINVLEKDLLSNFLDAVSFVKGHIDRLIKKFIFHEEIVIPIVRNAINNASDHIMEIKEQVDYMKALFDILPNNSSIYFVLSQDFRGLWSARAVQKKRGNFSVFVEFPKEWAGLTGKNLSEISGIEGGVFCHKKLFLSVWETKKSAEESIKIAMKNAR